MRKSTPARRRWEPEAAWYKPVTDAPSLPSRADNITRSAAQRQVSVQTFPEFSAELRRFPLTVAGTRGMDGRVKKTMRIFTIDAGNTIVVSTSTERGSKSGAARFTNEKQSAALAAHWPSGRLVEIWNNLPGVRKIAKFTDRQTGVSRIWRALERREAHVGAHAASGGDRTDSRGKAASRSEQPFVARTDTKAARVIALLKQPAGATLKAIMALTGWQSHSVRGFITAHVRQKLNCRVQSFKRGGERVYRIRP